MPAISSEEYRRLHRPSVVVSESGQPELPEEWDYEAKPSDDDMTPEQLEMRNKELIKVAPSQFVEFAIRMPDKAAQKHVPFSFEQRRYLRLPYDTPYKRMLYKCGRQVEKSTLLGNKSLSFCCIINAFTVLYVSPTNLQTKTFSRDRIKEAIDTSEVLRAWTTTKLSDSVFEKKFINRSQIILRYAYHNADRTRGIPADMVVIDELQDVITDNIPVIEQCASHSPFKIFIYSGTPKSYDNPIEYYWQRYSTQNEWTVPCERHGTPNNPSSWHWNVLGEANIQKKGLSCDKCGQVIYAMHPMANWTSMNPSVRKKLSEDGLYDGYRIPQLMVPWIPWHEIVDNYTKYSKPQFHNEVLGLSYDTGTRPLTRQDLINNCDPHLMMTQDALTRLRAQFGQATDVYAGIDWGTGESHSYTVLSLGAYIDGRFTIFYIHRFEGQETEPPIQLALIERLVKYWNVQLVGADYGGGFDRNDALARSIGSNRLVKYQYTTPGQKVKWDEGLKRFIVHRTEVMSDIFNAIKRGGFFRFINWEQFEEPYGKDFLSIFSEYSETLRQVQYKKAPDATDDAFHSVLFCFLASYLRHPRPDILNAGAKTGANRTDD